MLSLMSLALYREVEPFARQTTNSLVYIGQYSILLTYAGALAIETDVAKNVDSFAFGMCLVGANLVVIGVAAGVAAKRHADMGRWLSPIGDEDMRLLRAVENGTFYAGDPAPSGGDLELTTRNSTSTKCSKDPTSRNTELLKQYIIDAKSVKLERRVGAGAFGEVFVGTCLGQPAAIKTLKVVSLATAQSLRGEVLLTASLRHPGVVSFVGACWDQELTCLILGWLPRGSQRRCAGTNPS
jgi:hypothetical protein